MTRSVMVRNNKYRYAFMLSNWYSGATLFAILLNNHAKMTCNGETFPFKSKATGIYLCSCGKPLRECKFYRETTNHMVNKKNGKWDENLFLILPSLSINSIIDRWLKSFKYLYKIRDLIISHIPKYKSKISLFINSHLIFFKKSCENQGSDVYVDGTKSIRRAELFAKNAPSSFKIIYLVRDGRGFCYSYIKNRKLNKKKLPEAMKEWLEYINMVDIFSLRYPHISILTLRYEDLCKNPNKALSEACTFLGVSFDKNMMNVKKHSYHVLGNVMRKGFDGKIKESLAWKTEFTQREINEMNHTMGKALKRFEYV